MPDPFPVVDVSGWPVDEAESAGGEEKDWLRDPNDPDGALWLFKPRTERPGRVQGEDWAEKLSYEIAVALGLPAAHVELAVRAGRAGSISRSLRPGGWELQHGALLLSGIVPGFVVKSRKREGHTLDNIREVLTEVSAPADGHLDLPAFDVFAGYMLLDALVANQDRHEENWAVLRPLPGEGPLRLAGTYDHGSSLGFNLRDEERQLRLAEGVGLWAGRGRATRFDAASDGRLSLVELADKALSMAGSAGRHHWESALRTIRLDDLSRIVERVPNLSEVTRTFVSTLLDVNLGRLRHER